MHSEVCTFCKIMHSDGCVFCKIMHLKRKNGANPPRPRVAVIFVVAVPTRCSKTCQLGVQKRANSVFKSVPTRCSKKRQLGVQKRANSVFKNVPTRCLRTCQLGVQNAKKMQKYLRMSIIFSTFATEFERKGIIKTTPDSLTCVRDYRGFRVQRYNIFLNCANF